MRLIKMLGLAAVAMAAFMATVGVGSAMAGANDKVVWCFKRVHNCPANEDYPSGTEIFAGATKTEFLTNLVNATCTKSELAMTNTGLLVHGNVTALTFENCSTELAKCTIKAENLEYLSNGRLNAGLGYEISITEKTPNGVPQITIECGMIINCTYTTKEVSVAALLSFTPEVLKIEQAFVFSEGFMCAKIMIWDGTYQLECRESEAPEELKRCWVKMET